MNQEDYQKKIDEHRQSIGTDEEQELRRSRRAKAGKKKKKRSRNLLIPSLFFIFIMIPVGMFVYVQFFYNPEVPEQTEVGLILETKPITNGIDKDKSIDRIDLDRSLAVVCERHAVGSGSYSFPQRAFPGREEGGCRRLRAGRYP